MFLLCSVYQVFLVCVFCRTSMPGVWSYPPLIHLESSNDGGNAYTYITHNNKYTLYACDLNVFGEKIFEKKLHIWRIQLHLYICFVALYQLFLDISSRIHRLGDKVNSGIGLS